jgi:hypothetical protein
LLPCPNIPGTILNKDFGPPEHSRSLYKPNINQEKGFLIFTNNPDLPVHLSQWRKTLLRMEQNLCKKTNPKPPARRRCAILAGDKPGKTPAPEVRYLYRRYTRKNHPAPEVRNLCKECALNKSLRPGWGAMYCPAGAGQVIYPTYYAP